MKDNLKWFFPNDHAFNDVLDGSKTTYSVRNIIDSSRNQDKCIDDTTKLFTTLIGSLQSIHDNLTEVKHLSTSLSQDKDSILDTVSNISAVIEETAASCEEVFASMESEINSIH